MAGSHANGTQDAAGGGVLEESPQTAGCQAEPSDLVGDPDAEGSPATATCIAVATEDPPGTHRLLLGATLVESAQEAVSNQRADNLAVRAGRLLQPFSNRDPFRGAAVEPALLAHADRLHENRDSTGVGERRGSGGVREKECRGGGGEKTGGGCL